MGYLFTSESVSEGHPDKIADQISDALLDEFLRHDPEAKVACETLVTTGLVFCAGEVRTIGYIDIERVVRNTIRKIGYTKAAYRFDAESCGVISTIHEQSDDIKRGVAREKPEEQGAGDQGMMFGYATNDMDNYMPMPIEVAHILLQELAAIRKEGRVMTYLRPDSKSQVTIEYNDKHYPVRVDTIVLSTQHDEFGSDSKMQEIIHNDIKNILLPRVIATLPERIRALFRDDIRLLVNPTGKFVIGGPHGDTGLTGRKIIVDTYGGICAHGGGAFSGKDSSKVDRSAAYATRHIARNLVAAGVSEEVLIQVAYAIGVAQPVGLFVNTFGKSKAIGKSGKKLTDGQISHAISQIFDLRPYSIVKRFDLKNPIFEQTSTYGHFGRDHYIKPVEVFYPGNNIRHEKVNGREVFVKDAEFFAWEKDDYVDILKAEFRV